MTFSGQKVTFGVTFRVTLGETPKVTFSHFRVTLNFSGFRGFWEVGIFLTRKGLVGLDWRLLGQAPVY